MRVLFSFLWTAPHWRAPPLLLLPLADSTREVTRYLTKKDLKDIFTLGDTHASETKALFDGLSCPPAIREPAIARHIAELEGGSILSKHLTCGVSHHDHLFSDDIQRRLSSIKLPEKKRGGKMKEELVVAATTTPPPPSSPPRKTALPGPKPPIPATPLFFESPAAAAIPRGGADRRAAAPTAPNRAADEADAYFIDLCGDDDDDVVGGGGQRGASGGAGPGSSGGRAEAGAFSNVTALAATSPPARGSIGEATIAGSVESSPTASVSFSSPGGPVAADAVSPSSEEAPSGAANSGAEEFSPPPSSAAERMASPYVALSSSPRASTLTPPPGNEHFATSPLPPDVSLNDDHAPPVSDPASSLTPTTAASEPTSFSSPAQPPQPSMRVEKAPASCCERHLRAFSSLGFFRCSAITSCRCSTSPGSIELLEYALSEARSGALGDEEILELAIDALTVSNAEPELHAVAMAAAARLGWLCDVFTVS